MLSFAQRVWGWSFGTQRSVSEVRNNLVGEHDADVGHSRPRSPPSWTSPAGRIEFTADRPDTTLEARPADPANNRDVKTSGKASFTCKDSTPRIRVLQPRKQLSGAPGSLNGNRPAARRPPAARTGAPAANPAAPAASATSPSTAPTGRSRATRPRACTSPPPTAAVETGRLGGPAETSAQRGDLRITQALRGTVALRTPSGDIHITAATRTQRSPEHRHRPRPHQQHPEEPHRHRPHRAVPPMPPTPLVPPAPVPHPRPKLAGGGRHWPTGSTQAATDPPDTPAKSTSNAPTTTTTGSPNSRHPSPTPKTSLLMACPLVEPCMTDLVERLVPYESWWVFRRVVPPSEVIRPQGGAGVGRVIVAPWPRSPSWRRRAARGGNFPGARAQLADGLQEVRPVEPGPQTPRWTAQSSAATTRKVRRAERWMSTNSWKQPCTRPQS